MSRPPAVLQPLLDADGPCGLQRTRDGAWIATWLHAALDSASRRRGLLGRDHLPEGEALVIAPCQGVHTFGMRFPIDVVGLGRDGRVVTVRSAVPPRRIVLALRAATIVELPAGVIARFGLVRGDRLRIVPASGATAHDQRGR